jgi:ammonia channel protein AmtB
LEEQLAQVIASQAVTNTFFAETYYFLSIPLMMLIHVGFLSYEMGATRVKNVLSSGIKNLLAFSFTIVAWYLFGWVSIGHYQQGLRGRKAIWLFLV